MGIKSVFSVLALAALLPFLYERGRLLLRLSANAPSRLTRVNTFRSYDIKFADRLRSCEDVLLLEEQGLAVLACDAGRERWNTVMGIFLPGPITAAGLYAYHYKDVDTPDSEALKSIQLADYPDTSDFHTLGIAFDKETSTLYVSNHAQTGSRIDIFRLHVGSLVATYKGTVRHPLLGSPNSIAPISENEFYVTNDHYFTAKRSKILSQLETFLAPPIATVVHVKLQNGEVQAKVVARLPFANGIEVLNSTTVAVASTSRAAIYLYTRAQDATVLEYHSRFQVPFLPDNLSLSAGKLLIAGHGHIQTTLKFSNTRHICNDPVQLAQATAEMKEYCREGVATSWVSEWSHGEGLRHLYVDTQYPTSTTACRDAERGVGIVAGLYSKGILVWKE